MSAIGNFETVQPRDAMLEAYGPLRLEALAARRQRLVRQAGRRHRTFQAINGHRDAGSTACPGRYLYAKLPAIRQYPVQGPAQGWSGREPKSDLAGTMTTPTWSSVARVTSRPSSSRPAACSASEPVTQHVLAWPTPTRRGLTRPDRRRLGDIVVRGSQRKRHGPTRSATGSAARSSPPGPSPGAPDDRGGRPRRGRPQRPGRPERRHRPASAPTCGEGNGSFKGTWVPGTGRLQQLAATGDLDGDRHADLLSRDAEGQLWLHPGRARAVRRRVRPAGAGAATTPSAASVTSPGTGSPTSSFEPRAGRACTSHGDARRSAARSARSGG